MDQKQRQSTSGSRNIPTTRFETSGQQHHQYMPTQYDHSIQHFQTVEEISIENRQQILQQQQMEFIIYKGNGSKRQSFSRPPTSKQGRNEKTQRTTTLDDNSNNFIMNTTSTVGRIPLSIKQTTTALHIKNISKIPSTDTTQISQQDFNYSKQTKGFPVFQGKENVYQEQNNKSRSRASGENRHKDLTLDFKTLDSMQVNTCNNTYLEMFPDSACRNQTILNMSKDSNNMCDIQQKPCATQRNSSHTNRNHIDNPSLQTLNIPQHPKTIGKDSSNRDRSASKIRLNTRQFVKTVIQSQIFDLTYKDQVFSKNLKSFISESENFLQNNEKHYRIKYVMDLVQALISSIQAYIEDGGKNDRVGLERQALMKEKERFQKKVQKHKAQEADLKDKMQDFENVFSILTDMRLTFDEDKKEFIAAYVKKYKQTLFANNIEKNREEMVMEDERSVFLREVEKIKLKESFANEEIKRIKKEQCKLSDDVQEFIQIKGQFEQQKSMKHDQYGKMKLQIEEKLQLLEKETKEKEAYFKKYEAELKQREKILTDLILNNHTDSCQNENLMMSFNKTLNPMNSIDESYKQLDFDHFLGQFESHKDELIMREQALSKFLNRNDSQRTSYAMEILRSSYQQPLNQTKSIESRQKDNK